MPTPFNREEEEWMIPGEIFVDSSADPILANRNRAIHSLMVENSGDRPIQVGSHFHFFEVNRFLRFDRAAAYGMRLNIPAGTAVRFEPGEDKEVSLVSFGGRRIVFGCNGLVQGAIDDPIIREAALRRADQFVSNAQEGA